MLPKWYLLLLGTTLFCWSEGPGDCTIWVSQLEPLSNLLGWPGQVRVKVLHIDGNLGPFLAPVLLHQFLDYGVLLESNRMYLLGPEPSLGHGYLAVKLIIGWKMAIKQYTKYFHKCNSSIGKRNKIKSFIWIFVLFSVACLLFINMIQLYRLCFYCLMFWIFNFETYTFTFIHNSLSFYKGDEMEWNLFFTTINGQIKDSRIKSSTNIPIQCLFCNVNNRIVILS